MTKKCPSCNSCGMALENKDDFALQDETQAFCKYCTDEKGKLLPFEKILKMNADYYMDSQGITADAASMMARDMLKAQPAWRQM